MEIDFDVVSAVTSRRSVRTYNTDLQLGRDRLQQIAFYISTLDNPFGTDGIKIAVINPSELPAGTKLGTYGVIKGAEAYIGLMCKPETDRYIAAAYQFETLVLWLTFKGVGTVWMGGTLKRQAFASALGMPQDMVLPAISPIGYPGDKRLTERIMRRFSKGDTRKPWSTMFFDKTPETPLTKEAAGEFAIPLEMVRLAPSAVNAQPWRIIKDDAGWHFYVEYKNGLSDSDTVMKLMDIGIAMCHFDLTCTQQGVGGKFINAQPAISVPNAWHYIYTYRV